MSHRISLQAPPHCPLDASRLKQAAAAVLEQHQRPASHLTIVIADDAQIRALNRRHRQQDAPTDLLAFPADLPAHLQNGESYLGDIVIAGAYAAARAKRAHLKLDDVLCLLVVHAALHLLGYDHDSDETARRMWDAQAAALRRLHISPAIVSAYAETPDDETSAE